MNRLNRSFRPSLAAQLKARPRLQPASMQRSIRRAYADQVPPPADPRASDAKPHRAFYSNFSLAVFKSFLTALFTYQVLYWGWLKLESMENEQQGTLQIKRLEQNVRTLVNEKGEKR